jgi:hypothetical protein
LPTERTVAYPPDSLGSLSITEDEGTYSFELEDDYEALHRKWSATYRDLGVGRSRSGLSYATLWSLELSLASLQPEVGITTLRKKRAEKTLQKRRNQHKTTVQIDVYWFESEGDPILTSPGTRVELRVAGERYKPAEQDHGPLRETFLPGQGGPAIYRRNTFYFPRIVDGTDILKDAQGAELRVQRTEGRIRFAWSWESNAQAHVRTMSPEPLPVLRSGDPHGHTSGDPAPSRRAAPTFDP